MKGLLCINSMKNKSPMHISTTFVVFKYLNLFFFGVYFSISDLLFIFIPMTVSDSNVMNGMSHPSPTDLKYHLCHILNSHSISSLLSFLVPLGSLQNLCESAICEKMSEINNRLETITYTYINRKVLQGPPSFYRVLGLRLNQMVPRPQWMPGKQARRHGSGQRGFSPPSYCEILPIRVPGFYESLVVFNECITPGKLCTSKPVAITAAALVK